MHPRQPTPPPFFRRPSSASSSSFLSSTTSYSETDESTSDTDSEDEETEGYASSSGISGDEGRFIRRLDLSISGAGSGQAGGGPARFAGSSAANGVRSGTNSARSNLKLSLAVLRARHALASQQYEALAAALKSLSSALPPLSSLVSLAGGENPLGVFLPILARLAKDVRASLSSEEKGREFRRKKLAKEDAKALIALQQRWSATGRGDGGKGKGREVEADWVALVDELVQKNPSPPFLADPIYVSRTPALLTSLESFLLPSSLPRISLSNLDLHDDDLVAWPALRRLHEVVTWYLSFAMPDAEEAGVRAQKALQGVRSLDLSKNKLSTFPLYLTRLLPNLETLSLSHNLFPHLPAWVTLFSSLRRLRTHGNRLVSSRKALKPLPNGKSKGRKRDKAHPRNAGTRADARASLAFIRTQLALNSREALLPSSTSAIPPSLVSISTQLAQNLPGLPASAASDAFDLSPLSSSLPSSPNPANLPACPSEYDPLDRVHHLDPGIALPSHIPPRSPHHPSLSNTPPSSSPFASPFAERPATVEQRVLLALLARLDARPPAPPVRRTSSSASLSSLASTSTTSNGPPRRRPTRRERDWENGKAVLPTLVIGGAGEQSEGYRFCVLCAAAHLGLETELEEKGVQWECVCVVCVEERRVREGAPAPERDEGQGGEVARSKAKVMRWLRRKERIESETAAMRGLSIA
ncbi:hypothetical protein JCM10213v2_002920 [Rhodosporidiobolus nylandii]